MPCIVLYQGMTLPSRSLGLNPFAEYAELISSGPTRQTEVLRMYLTVRNRPVGGILWTENTEQSKASCGGAEKAQERDATKAIPPVQVRIQSLRKGASPRDKLQCQSATRLARLPGASLGG